MGKKIIILLFFLISISIFSRDILLNGQIINGKNMPNTTISIKNNDNLFNLKTDEKGFFKKDIDSGITTILVEKQGYFDEVLIKLLEKRSESFNVKIKLKQKKYFIQGVIHDGITAIPSVKLGLKTVKGVKVKESFSNDEGDYEFVDIPGTEDLYIEVLDSRYHYFKSEPITLKRSLEHFHIMLQKK